MEPRIGDPRVGDARPPETVVRERRSILSPQLVFGLVFIVAGALFTLDNLGLADAERYWRWWPTALILVGLAKLWQAQTGVGNPVAGVFFLLVGSWFQLHTLGLIDRDLWNFWPLLLVFIGVMIVYQGLRGRKVRASAQSDAILGGVAILGGWKRSTNAKTFRGGELTAIMGGCEVDLRHAEINGEAVIEVFAMWGGIEIRVPEDWTVINRVTPIMGGVEDGTRPPHGATPHRLTISGVVIMGGIEVKN
jgi:hypothetical protein